jgi:aryl-alcohol dehydrogenase-like predicted oxidoreductase
MHWPERKTNNFGQRAFHGHDDVWEDNFREILETFDGLIKEGKIKHIGVSNENSWGMMRLLEESKYQNLPRIKTVQNPYSLLNRLFEVNSAEVSKYENVGLLGYSPLAFGVLTGKFLTGESHPKARINLFPQYKRYNSDQCTEATKLYQEIAKKHGLTLTQLAMGFVLAQPFLTSAIIGATTLEQLKENIDTIDVMLSKEILAEIDAVQAIIPDPAP